MKCFLDSNISVMTVCETHMDIFNCTLRVTERVTGGGEKLSKCKFINVQCSVNQSVTGHEQQGGTVVFSDATTLTSSGIDYQL